MTKQLLVLKESRAGEQRVALTPEDVKILTDKDCRVFIESDAGIGAGFSNQDYIDAGAEIRHLENNDYQQLFKDIHYIIRAKRPNREREILENQALPHGSMMIGALDPLEKNAIHMSEYKQAGVTVCSIDQLELASDDPMNLLAAMSKIAGQLALLDALEKYQGEPESAVIIGFGIVGQAAFKEALKQKIKSITVILSNPQKAEEIKSLGGSVVLFDRNLALPEQQALVKSIIDHQDIVITSARRANQVAPLLIPSSTLATMKPGSVIVDMALSEGGNVDGAEHDATHTLGNQVIVTNTSGYPKACPREASILWSQATRLYLLKQVLKK